LLRCSAGRPRQSERYLPVFLITSRNEVTGARIFPSPLDDAYLWAAVRYVERNLKITAGQVLPGIVEKELQIDINGLLNS